MEDQLEDQLSSGSVGFYEDPLLPRAEECLSLQHHDSEPVPQSGEREDTGDISSTSHVVRFSCDAGARNTHHLYTIRVRPPQITNLPYQSWMMNVTVYLLHLCRTIGGSQLIVGLEMSS